VPRAAEERLESRTENLHFTFQRQGGEIGRRARLRSIRFQPNDSTLSCDWPRAFRAATISNLRKRKVAEGEK